MRFTHGGSIVVNFDAILQGANAQMDLSDTKGESSLDRKSKQALAYYLGHENLKHLLIPGLGGLKT